jgi:hypothetical protein
MLCSSGTQASHLLDTTTGDCRAAAVRDLQVSPGKRTRESGSRGRRQPDRVVGVLACDDQRKPRGPAVWDVLCLPAHMSRLKTSPDDPCVDDAVFSFCSVSSFFSMLAVHAAEAAAPQLLHAVSTAWSSLVGWCARWRPPHLASQWKLRVSSP